MTDRLDAQMLTDMKLTNPESDGYERSELGLGDLPEPCIAAILALTTPRDVARVACTSRVFREASNTDVVWKAMLPSYYTDILAQVNDAPPSTCSKKQIYDYLCNRVMLQDGNQDYWIDRPTGGVCQSIAARACNIAWRDDLRYWKWCSRTGSRFPEVGYLKQVCWFEVQGRMRSFLQPGTYNLSWRLLLDNLTTHYGWTDEPVKFWFSTTYGQEIRTQFYLTPDGRRRNAQARPAATWMEVLVGKFVIEAEDSPVDLQFSMTEIVSGNWKSGLFLDCFVIRSSSVKGEETAIASETHMDMRDRPQLDATEAPADESEEVTEEEQDGEDDHESEERSGVEEQDDEDDNESEERWRRTRCW